MTNHPENYDIDILFKPIQLNGTIVLKNRIVMAPMTRFKADKNLVPTLAMAKYYARRAQSGLIITEATIVRALLVRNVWKQLQYTLQSESCEEPGTGLQYRQMTHALSVSFDD